MFPQFSKNPSILMALTLILGLSVALQCDSAQKKKKKKGPPVRFEIKCEGGQAVRYHIIEKTGSTTEKGPVSLAKDMTCSKARKLERTQMIRLKRNGTWEEFYKDTKIVLSRGEFKENKREGVRTYYTKKGQRTKTVMYVKGKKEGQELLYFAGTDIWKRRGMNKAGKRTGPWEMRKHRESPCIEKGDYKKGDKVGPWVECGMLPKERNPRKKYYTVFRGSYKKGLRSGPVELFHANGRTLGKGNYYADTSCLDDPPAKGKEACARRMGPWVIYHANSQTAMRGSYDKKTGNKVGNWVEFYQSGQKMGEGKRNHTRVGFWTFYGKNGKIIGKYSFDGSDVSIQSGSIYSKNGVKLAEAKPGQGCRKRKNRRGRMVTSCRVEAGGFLAALAKYSVRSDSLVFVLKARRGGWIIFKNGQKVGEGTFLAGKKHGTWSELIGGRWQTNDYMFGRKKR